MGDKYPEFSLQDIYVKERKVDVQDMDELMNLAKLDGATIITRDGRLKAANVELINREETEEQIRRERKKDNRRRQIFTQRGSRHKAAIMTSIEYPEALIFVVSQNRDITVLCDHTLNEKRFFLYET